MNPTLRQCEVLCKQKPSLPESIENRLLDTASEEKVKTNPFRLARSSFQIQQALCKQKSQVLKRTENSQREPQLVEISPDSYQAHRINPHVS
jgi:hypothetical protein